MGAMKIPGFVLALCAFGIGLLTAGCQRWSARTPDTPFDYHTDSGPNTHRVQHGFATPAAEAPIDARSAGKED